MWRENTTVGLIHNPGAPVFRTKGFEKLVPILTTWRRWDKKFNSQLHREQGKPHDKCLRNSLLGTIVLKAEL